MALTALLPPTPLLLALVLLLLALLYRYGTRTYGTLEKLGIPVIEPYPFMGSVLRPWRIIAWEEDARNAKRYGRIWGQYEGPTPQVFVADLELAKRVLIKDFDYFTDRPILFDCDLGRDMLDLLPGEQWKKLRSILTPSLVSGAKLKAMVPTMTQCTEEACRRLDAKLLKSPVLTIKNELFGPIAMDIMAQFSFSMKVPNVDDTSSKFVKSAMVFGSPSEPTPWWLTVATTSFPSLANYMSGRALVPAFRYFLELLRRTVKERRAEGVSRTDLVGALMDAIDNKVPTAEFRQLGIDADMVLLQGAEMLMAGYDTTGSALSVAAYYLATHPEIAARVVAEVAEAGPLTSDALHRLPLLEACIKESMRLTPLISRHYRLCTRDWEHDGLRIPAGTWVIVPVWPFHVDPAVFPEPERFLPDRWLGEEGRALGQYSWMPFGLGPRACIGSRLATMECKFVLAYLLTRYRLSAASETRLEHLKGVSLIAGHYPIQLKVEKLK